MTLPQPYYDRDGVTLYCGDAWDVLPELPQADIILTSPPYNKNRRIDGTWQGIVTETCKGSRFRGGYGEHTDDMPMLEYEMWQRGILRMCWDRLTDNGAIYYNHKPRVINGELWTPMALNPGLPLRQIVVWNTGPGINFMPGAYVPAHEWVMIFARPAFRLDGARASALGDVWTFPPAPTDDHPAPFPVALAERVIASTGARTVIDPFVGSGTTLRAAMNLGVQAIGIELSERHCATAARRLQQAVLPLDMPA